MAFGQKITLEHKRSLGLLLLLCLLLMLQGCASVNQEPSANKEPSAVLNKEPSAVVNKEPSNSAEQTQPNPDPWERMNRRIHRFNDVADRFITKPIAKIYQKIIPNPVRKSLGNVYANLGDINDALNNLLQGKPREGLINLARVTVNTTLGLGGLFDPASRMGLPDHDEDFGQTLAKWGLPAGPYLVLPLLGPSTLRGAITRPLDGYMDPLVYLDPVSHRNQTYGIRLIHQRGKLLSAEEAIFGDRYLFIRDAYLQRRDYLIHDGEIEDPFGDDF